MICAHETVLSLQTNDNQYRDPYSTVPGLQLLCHVTRERKAAPETFGRVLTKLARNRKTETAKSQIRKSWTRRP